MVRFIEPATGVATRLPDATVVPLSLLKTALAAGGCTVRADDDGAAVVAVSTSSRKVRSQVLPTLRFKNSPACPTMFG